MLYNGPDGPDGPDGRHAFAVKFIVHEVHKVHPVHQKVSLFQTFAVKLIVEPTFDALIGAFFFSDRIQAFCESSGLSEVLGKTA